MPRYVTKSHSLPPVKSDVSPSSQDFRNKLGSDVANIPRSFGVGRNQREQVVGRQIFGDLLHSCRLTKILAAILLIDTLVCVDDDRAREISPVIMENAITQWTYTPESIILRQLPIVLRYFFRAKRLRRNVHYWKGRWSTFALLFESDWMVAFVFTEIPWSWWQRHSTGFLDVFVKSTAHFLCLVWY